MIVVVLVALGQATDPSTQSLTTAAQDGLGPTALVVVREAPPESLAAHSDSEKTGELLHADAVATVEWSDDAHEHAHVAVYSTRAHAWQDRSVTFAPADATTERGRQIGYGIAAMVPPPEQPPPPPPQNPPPRDEPPAPEPPNERPRTAVDIVAVGATGVAGGFGAELSLRERAWRSLSLRAGGGLRFGSISAADASFTDVRFDAGPAIVFFSWPSFDLGTRADFVMTRIGVSRDAGSGTTNGSHWVAGA
ncbi:MAG: hypothetical protein ACRELY_18525, partial [Polyangiaceae bacterium]